MNESAFNIEDLRQMMALLERYRSLPSSEVRSLLHELGGDDVNAVITSPPLDRDEDGMSRAIETISEVADSLRSQSSKAVLDRLLKIPCSVTFAAENEQLSAWIHALGEQDRQIELMMASPQGPGYPLAIMQGKELAPFFGFDPEDVTKYSTELLMISEGVTWIRDVLSDEYPPLCSGEFSHTVAPDLLGPEVEPAGMSMP